MCYCCRWHLTMTSAIYSPFCDRKCARKRVSRWKNAKDRCHRAYTMADTTLVAVVAAPNRTVAMMRPMVRLKWHYLSANSCGQFYLSVPVIFYSFHPMTQSSLEPLVASLSPNHISAILSLASKRSEKVSAFLWSIQGASLLHLCFVRLSGHCLRWDWMLKLTEESQTCIDCVTIIVFVVDAFDVPPNANSAHWFSPVPGSGAFRWKRNSVDRLAASRGTEVSPPESDSPNLHFVFHVDLCVVSPGLVLVPVAMAALGLPTIPRTSQFWPQTEWMKTVKENNMKKRYNFTFRNVLNSDDNNRQKHQQWCIR